MEYIARNCPKCNGELQVPVDLTTCICMYCGEHISVIEEEKKEVTPEEAVAMEAAYNKALTQIPRLLEDYERMLILFTADKYAGCFDEYEHIGRQILEPASVFAGLSSENREIVIKELAGTIYESIEQLLKEKAKRHKAPKSTLIDQLRFFQTIYLVPMILHLDYDISDPLVDLVIIAWFQAYPQYPYKKSDFEHIAMGFRRKGLCFITTAVCETLDRPDDCYELTSFRQFRDTFMLEDDTRRVMVEEYYRIAPVIVTSINMNPDSKERYSMIWSKYLKPCLQAIEEKRLEDCARQYAGMVMELKRQYYYIG